MFAQQIAALHFVALAMTGLLEFDVEGVGVEAHVVAEFVDGDGLVFGFVVLFFDGGDDVAALTFAFSGDLLDVFGVDTDSLHGLF
ncbi:hypothetical protein [Flavobacterium sp.]|uniref:hypothetical protein n=1 Tax=Flavobacterium sp. TaxID=239 RepID=UPI0028BD85E1|nr:hypothetical protein [Flavobacterium sp.]